MEPQRVVSAEGIHEAYEQSEAAVLTVVLGIMATHFEQVGKLEARIQALEDQLKKTARTAGNRRRVMG
jgi:hypothetical protein